MPREGSGRLAAPKYPVNMSVPVSYDFRGTRADEEFLLALLNSTPVVDGAPTDGLTDLRSAKAWLRRAGGLGSAAELRHVRRARAALQGVVRGELDASALEAILRGAVLVPAVDDQVRWHLKVPSERGLAVRAVLAWGALARAHPGRLRPCANDECRLFLVDRSKSNRARWCSMAVCGNRMKARRHYERARQAARRR